MTTEARPGQSEACPSSARLARPAPNSRQELYILFAQPVLTPATLEEKLGVSYVTANNHVARLGELGILQETTGYKRNRRFSFAPYLALFESAAPAAPPGGP